MRARCGPFPVFPGILPGGEAHNKPLWRVFPNACGWSPKAFGRYMVFLSALQGFFCFFLLGLMVFICPSVPNSALVGPCWDT